jgi:Domain of unknown function (DUF4124)
MKRVLLCTVLIAWSAIAFAVVYKWTDAQGNVHYGDQPPDGVQAEIVEGLGNHISSLNAAPRPAAQPASAASGAAAPAKDKPFDPAAADAAAAARAQQCADAQARLKQATEGRHLFKPGPNGEREYLTSDQIDAERADAKKEVDTVCATSN